MDEMSLTVEEFFGARSGRTVGDEGQPVDLAVVPIGSLAVPSGRLGVVDPFATLDEPLGVQIDAGTYPVILTQATYPERFPDTDLDDTELDDTEFENDALIDAAYLSLVLADGEPVSVEPVPGTWVDGVLYGVTTWGSSVGFVDGLAARGHVLEPESAEFEAWNAVAGQHPHGVLNVPLPWGTRGENVIGVATAQDEGAFPLYVTRDASGRALAIHVDFLEVGEGRWLLFVQEWPPRPEHRGLPTTWRETPAPNRWPPRRTSTT